MLTRSRMSVSAPVRGKESGGGDDEDAAPYPLARQLTSAKYRREELQRRCMSSSQVLALLGPRQCIYHLRSLQPSPESHNYL